MLCSAHSQHACTTQGRLGVAEAVDAARLEEAAQIEEWGLVEGGHDIDISDLKVL